MRWLRMAWFRVMALVRRDRIERELSEELAFHLDMETRKHLDRGLAPDQARRTAHLRFGGVERMRQRARRAWGVSLAQDVQDDTRFALRQLRKRPAFSFLAILTLGLGMGGTVALFSVVHGLLIRPLPYADDQALVAFWQRFNWRGVEYDFVRETAEAYEDVAAHSLLGGPFRLGDRTSTLLTGAVSANLFDVLDVAPVLGRTFRPGEDRPGAERTLVLSHAFWHQEMGGDPGAVGRRVVYDGTPFTVIGIMPEGFFFPNPEVQAWQPLELDPDSRDYQGNGWLNLVGRLRPGVTPEQVQADLDRLTAALGERFEYPEAWDKTRGAYVEPLRDEMVGDVRPALLLLLGAVALLLLMACANVAALLLTRTADRSGEIAVRAAMGAGRGRIARQVLTESVVLGLLSGLLGLALARASFDVLVSMLPLRSGFDTTLVLSWPALGGAFVLACLVGALVSVAPIRSLLAGGLADPLRAGRTESGGSGGRSRLHAALVTSEVLLCVVLVSGAALLVRTVANLRDLDPGLDPRGVLAVDLLPPEAETTNAERAAFFDALLERVLALPGVEAAGYTNRLPIRDGGWQGTVAIEDRPDLDGPRRPNSFHRTASTGYFEAMGMRVVRGRGFDEGDRTGSVEVAVVNEAFAERMWPGQDPVGRRIESGFEVGRGTWLTVVGVVADHRVQGMVGEMPMVTYRPERQRTNRSGNLLVVRGEGDPLAQAGPIRSAVQSLDPRVAVARVTTMTDVVDRALAEPLRLRFFLGLFGLLGLALGTVGIYGVVSYSVRRRWAELGIRTALGAEPAGLARSVLGRSLVPVLLGLLAGVGGSLAASRVLGRFVYGVAATDPLSLGGAAAVLLLSALAAAAVPAFRAGRIRPIEALRAD